MNSKIRIRSKKLNSGRFQVDFSAEGKGEEYYGYLLAEAKTSVNEVIDKISRHVMAMHDSNRYYQRNLFSLCKREVNSGRILIFKR